MTDYDNSNTFVLFMNDKGDNPKRPDRTGTLNVGGVEYYMDGWIKQGAKGPFLSGTIKPKEARNEARAEPKPQPEFADENVPF